MTLIEWITMVALLLLLLGAAALMLLFSSDHSGCGSECRNCHHDPRRE
jgi:hypothetical protein